MAKKITRQRVDAGESEKYLLAARQYVETADLAKEAGNWTSAGLLMVHGAIAYADAVTIRLKSVKSTSDNHKDAGALLGEVIGGMPGRKEALNHLDRIIDEKNAVSYGGITFGREDVAKLAKHLERFQSFAEKLLL